MTMVAQIFILSILVLGSLALPQPNLSKSQLFEHVDRSARIVGGKPAPMGSHPHMVALTTGYIIPSFFCGASLISRRTVLTAAHCVEAVFDDEEGALVRSLRARVGSNIWIVGGTSIQFSHNITNPNYDPDFIKNDLGLLITTDEVWLTSAIYPVPLSSDHVPGDVAVKVAGWGRIGNGGPISFILLELEMSTIDGAECSSLIEQTAAGYNISAPPVDPAVEVCTLHSVGHGVCNGDSGSALVQVDNGKQIGIVSWGFPCANGAPDMFTRISGFTSWLNESIV